MANAAGKVKLINKNQAGPSSSKPIVKRKIETSTKQSFAAETKNKSIPLKTAKSDVATPISDNLCYPFLLINVLCPFSSSFACLCEVGLRNLL